ncbi:PD-(D/E)XK nuclease family protein [Candidatus Peregrinibacteria bacterium]|nr:PD-(D/E)XK nuclease family protein [Candidatus Peregrinibacteria bacterium]
MSDYYTPLRTRNIYDPSSKEPFRLSRSRIENFVNCPRCFYLDRRLGVNPHPGFPFTLNSAVDALLKKEFDKYRNEQKAHPLMTENGIEAVPFQHEKMDEWRENFKGVQFLHEPTNLLITGAVDDIWVKPDGELIVADYKATSKAEEITALDKDWQDGYKRQSEVYQWLLRQNGFKVSDTAYFVYANGDTEKEAFNNRLEFDTRLIPYTGDDSWVEPTLKKIKECLDSDEIPESGEDCDSCAYREAANKALS